MKNVLIIEDDAVNLSCAEMALKSFCLTVPASSVSRALKYLESGTPDLILLDVSLPFMDGFTLTKQIRENARLSNVPVIFLTPALSDDVVKRGTEMGAVDFVTKPFIPSILAEKVYKALLAAPEVTEVPEEKTAAVAPADPPAGALPVQTAAPAYSSAEEAAPAAKPASAPAPSLSELVRPAPDFASAPLVPSAMPSMADATERSIHDNLTGLYNRNHAASKINEILTSGQGGALFIIDLDNFSQINEQFGNIAGDTILRQFASVLKSLASVNDVLCRVHGDEFAVFFTGMSDKKQAVDRIERIKSALKKTITNTAGVPELTLSAGISKAPSDGTDFASIFDAADKALYHVKQSGKNAYHFFGNTSQFAGGLPVDIKTLEEMLSSEDETGAGVYRMDFEDFHQVYNFIRRNLKRDKKNVQCVLFTLVPGEGMTPDTMETELAVEMLEQAVYETLRSGDVSTRYSNRQIVVIVMDADGSAAEGIVKRIADAYYKRYLAGRFNLGYDFIQMREN